MRKMPSDDEELEGHAAMKYFQPVRELSDDGTSINVVYTVKIIRPTKFYYVVNFLSARLLYRQIYKFINDNRDPIEISLNKCRVFPSEES